MNFSLLLGLYGASVLGVIAYFWLLPRSAHMTAAAGAAATSHLDFYTTGTGELHKCFPFRLKILVDQQRVRLPQHQVDVLCLPQAPRQLIALGEPRGILLNRNPKKLS